MLDDVSQLYAADASARRQGNQGNAMEDVAPCEDVAPPVRITIYLKGRDGPYADVPFELAVEGRTISAPGARTPPDGKIEYDIAAASASGELRVWFDRFQHPEIYLLTFMPAAPAASAAGLADRVRACGVHPGPGGKLDEAHVRELERLLGLPETGAPTGPWQAAVSRLHGG